MNRRVLLIQETSSHTDYWFNSVNETQHRAHFTRATRFFFFPVCTILRMFELCCILFNIHIPSYPYFIKPFLIHSCLRTSRHFFPTLAPSPTTTSSLLYPSASPHTVNLQGGLFYGLLAAQSLLALSRFAWKRTDRLQYPCWLIWCCLNVVGGTRGLLRGAGLCRRSLTVAGLRNCFTTWSLLSDFRVVSCASGRRSDSWITFFMSCSFDNSCWRFFLLLWCFTVPDFRTCWRGCVVVWIAVCSSQRHGPLAEDVCKVVRSGHVRVGRLHCDWSFANGPDKNMHWLKW